MAKRRKPSKPRILTSAELGIPNSERSNHSLGGFDIDSVDAAGTRKRARERLPMTLRSQKEAIKREAMEEADRRGVPYVPFNPVVTAIDRMFQDYPHEADALERYITAYYRQHVRGYHGTDYSGGGRGGGYDRLPIKPGQQREGRIFNALQNKLTLAQQEFLAEFAAMIFPEMGFSARRQEEVGVEKICTADRRKGLGGFQGYLRGCAETLAAGMMEFATLELRTKAKKDYDARMERVRLDGSPGMIMGGDFSKV